MILTTYICLISSSSDPQLRPSTPIPCYLRPIVTRLLQATGACTSFWKPLLLRSSWNTSHSFHTSLISPHLFFRPLFLSLPFRHLLKLFTRVSSLSSFSLAESTHTYSSNYHLYVDDSPNLSWKCNLSGTLEFHISAAYLLLPSGSSEITWNSTCLKLSQYFLQGAYLSLDFIVLY